MQQQNNISHSLQLEILEEMRQRKDRDETIKARAIPLWAYAYLFIVVLSIAIILVHPYIMELVDSNI